MESEIAASAWDDLDANWDGLERVLSELGLADLASKAKLLQSLSSFLSGVATTMSFSEEFHALSAWIGESAVFLGHTEVSQLHELVVRELKDQTYFLSEVSWTGNKQIDVAADGSFRSLNLEIVSQTLRCCMRILPLVDCFDKSASLSSTRLLDHILEQLCEPAKLFQFLGLKDTQPHRKEVILAMLEVYMDELLLRPDLIARFVSSREGVCLSLTQEQTTWSVRHTEASLAASFVHVLSQAARVSRRNGCNLSLPAGLILLEKFSQANVPPFSLELVVGLLARILNTSTPPGFRSVEEPRKTRRDVQKHCWAGGVEWSHSSQELPFTNVLQSQSALNFASSILECGIMLYMRFSLASDTCPEGTGSDRYHTLEGSLLQSHLSKYFPLFDVLGEGHNSLVAALLKLMSCALNCIGREVCMLTWFPDAYGDQFLNAQAMPLSEFATSDFDKILQCVGLYLSLCLPSRKALCPMSEEERFGRVKDDGGDSLNVLVGRSIVFFTDILRCEVHRGAPDEVLERYFHLVKSLVALLRALDEKNDSRNSVLGYDSVCNRTPSDDNCANFLERFGYGKCKTSSPCEDGQHLPKAVNNSSYLQEMVFSLKGVLQDLSLQQRSIPAFSAALSDLLEGKHLAGSQWILYLSETKQHPLRFESHCHLETNSTEQVPRRDHVDGQQTEFQPTSSRAALLRTVVEESQDHARTLASNIVLTGDQNLQIKSDLCSAVPNFPTGTVLSASQEENLRMQSDDGPTTPSSEYPVSNVVVTVEKRQLKSATLRTAQKLHTEADGVGNESLQPEQSKQCSSTTSAIIKRLLQKRALSTRESTNMRPAGVNELIPEVEEPFGQTFLDDLIADRDSHTSSKANLFVDSLSELDPSKDNFDDLKDFIVPKKGRDYSKWLKRRQKVRRRLYSKNLVKRLHEKKELLLLLDIT